MASKNVEAVNDMNFDDKVLKSDLPVLVDFTATWCAPCKAIAPFVDQIADEYVGRVRVAKCDIEESPAIAQKYGVVNVPRLYVFKGGQLVAQQLGAVPKKKMEELISRAL